MRAYDLGHKELMERDSEEGAIRTECLDAKEAAPRGRF